LAQVSHITVCGHFADGQKLADGQTVKTQTIVAALKDTYGVDKVSICDTYRWSRNPLRMLFRCIQAARSSSDVIILPAKKGVLIFIPLFYFLKKRYEIRLHYSVIGGWLFERLSNNRSLLRYLQAFTTIQVETQLMKIELEKLQINRVFVVPNFKTIDAITEKECRERTFTRPLPLCTFSRVMSEKGIEDAIEVVSRINSRSNKPHYTLDIYGSIDENYKGKFKKAMVNAPPEISYKGVVESSKSVEVLKNYYLLLFPTHFMTEGLPGTIIDGYAAGLPVLSARWNSFSEVIKEGKTGYGIELGNNRQFYKLLIDLEDSRFVLPLKKNCLEAFVPYSYSQGCQRLRVCIETEK